MTRTPRPYRLHSAPRTARIAAVAALLTTLLALPASASAQSEAAADAAAAVDASGDPAGTSRPRPLWEVGAVAFGTRQQAYPGSALTVSNGLALPWLIYRGRWLRADEGTFGVRALKTPRTEIDIGFAGAFGSSASESAVRRGMPDIGTLVEFGPRLKLNLGTLDASSEGTPGAAGAATAPLAVRSPTPDGLRWRLALPLRGVFDLSDGLAHRGLSFEPELGLSLRSGRWRLGASLSAVIGDRRLAGVFYGVDPVFATATRPAYTARAGLITTRLGFNASTDLGPDWRVFGFARLDSVAGAANRASPLVERTRGTSYGVGLSWTWLRSERMTTN